MNDPRPMRFLRKLRKQISPSDEALSESLCLSGNGQDALTRASGRERHTLLASLHQGSYAQKGKEWPGTVQALLPGYSGAALSPPGNALHRWGRGGRFLPPSAKRRGG